MYSPLNNEDQKVFHVELWRRNEADNRSLLWFWMSNPFMSSSYVITVMHYINSVLIVTQTYNVLMSSAFSFSWPWVMSIISGPSFRSGLCNSIFFIITRGPSPLDPPVPPRRAWNKKAMMIWKWRQYLPLCTFEVIRLRHLIDLFHPPFSLLVPYN